MLRYLLLSGSFFVCWILNAQNNDITNLSKNDTTSIGYALKSGETHLYARYFFSNTINQGFLSDYYANAASTALTYTSNRHRKIYIGLSGFSFFNLGSSNMQALDLLSNQPNRYEIGLFDIDHPGNYQHPVRLDELYVQLSLKKSFVRLGRQFINTPFINEQDGRLRGTSVAGIYLVSSRFKSTTFYGAWLTKVSPRSTTAWYRIEESIGVNSQGVNSTGDKANYRDHLTSEGLGFFGAKIDLHPAFEWQVWDVIIDNILNTAFTQFTFLHKLKKEKIVRFSGQLIHQQAINNGGHFDSMYAYTPKAAQALTFGGRIAVKSKLCEWSLNYNAITKQGRYVFPREWGRDPFFTFLQRERNEGSGGSQAVVLKFDCTSKNKLTNLSIGTGYVNMPDVKNYAFNKYGLPSYFQWNTSLKHDFKKWVQGLEGQLLVVVKTKSSESYLQPKYEINKVNMLLTNIIINYHF